MDAHKYIGGFLKITTYQSEVLFFILAVLEVAELKFSIRGWDASACQFAYPECFRIRQSREEIGGFLSA